MVSKAQFVGPDWNHITRLHSQLANMNSLTAKITKNKQKKTIDRQSYSLNFTLK